MRKIMMTAMLAATLLLSGCGYNTLQTNDEQVWDTRDNSGVLIYVLFADRAIEIVADRGIDTHSGNATWESIATNVQSAFSAGDFLAGALFAVTAVSEQLQHHVPHERDGEGELPNHVTML